MEDKSTLMEPATNPPVPQTSLAGRLFNVLATPGEVFDEIKAAPATTANWLLPLLLALITGIAAVLVIYSQPAVLQQMHEQQTKVLEAKVKAGTMTQAQADQAEAMMDKFGGPGMTKFIGCIFVGIIVVLRLFWLALILWVFGKWLLQANFAYGKALEVVGLAYVVTILGSIACALLSISLGKLVTASAALFAGDMDPQSVMHTFLQSLDFFDFWMFGILTVGLARLASVAWPKALSLIICYWLVMEGITIGISWFFTALGNGFK